MNFLEEIVLMLWIYWLCYVFVFGMTINEYKLNNKEHDIEEKK